MLKSIFSSLSLCLIGYNNVLGKIFIKRLTNYFTFENQKLYLIELKSDEVKRERFLNDNYFTAKEKSFIKEHV